MWRFIDSESFSFSDNLNCRKISELVKQREATIFIHVPVHLFIDLEIGEQYDKDSNPLPAGRLAKLLLACQLNLLRVRFINDYIIAITRNFVFVVAVLCLHRTVNRHTQLPSSSLPTHPAIYLSFFLGNSSISNSFSPNFLLSLTDSLASSSIQY